LCIAQGLVERSRQKTDLLKGYGDTVFHTEGLEKELDKLKKHSALLQSKLEGTFTQYHKEVQEMQAKRDELIKKNKTLRKKNKGMPPVMATEYLSPSL
jgi:FtsZ-binding cell division protein ZapB